MDIRTQAIVCAARPHGETAVIARVLTESDGLVAAYVAGGRGRALRPVLIPGNTIDAQIRANAAGRLPFMKAELVTSRGPLMTEPLPAVAIGWATAMSAAVLPELTPMSALYPALAALMEAIATAPSARGWVPGLILYEALVLRELGYGGTRPQPADWAGTLDQFDAMGALLVKRLLAERAGPVMGELAAARSLLRDRLQRMA